MNWTTKAYSRMRTALKANTDGEKMRHEQFTNIIRIEKVSSTNTYVKKHSAELDHGTVLFADEQTEGRGRLGRSWYGEKGRSIFCSFLIKNIYENSDAVRLSFLFSIAVKVFLMKYIDNSKITLKWPNDIMITDKKICGILSEYSKECVIIGVGINVYDFIPQREINCPYTTIEAEGGTIPDINIIQNEFVQTVNSVFTRYCTNSLKDLPMIWFREAGIKNRTVSVDTQKIIITGTIDSIDDLGSLVIINVENGKKETIFYGDVTYND